MRVRGLQELKVKFKAKEDTAESLIDALLMNYGKFQYEESCGRYELTKILPIIIDKYDGKTQHDSQIQVKDLDNFIRRWDSYFELNDLEVYEEIGEEE